MRAVNASCGVLALSSTRQAGSSAGGTLSTSWAARLGGQWSVRQTLLNSAAISDREHAGDTASSAAMSDSGLRPEAAERVRMKPMTAGSWELEVVLLATLSAMCASVASRRSCTVAAPGAAEHAATNTSSAGEVGAALMTAMSVSRRLAAQSLCDSATSACARERVPKWRRRTSAHCTRQTPEGSTAIRCDNSVCASATTSVDAR